MGIKMKKEREDGYCYKINKLLMCNKKSICKFVILTIIIILALVLLNQNLYKNLSEEIEIEQITFNEVVELGMKFNLQSDEVVREQLHNLCNDILAEVDKNNLIQFYKVKQRLTYENNKKNSIILNAIVITSLEVTPSKVIEDEKIETLFVIDVENKSSNNAEYILSDTYHTVSHDKKKIIIEVVGYYRKARNLLIPKGFEIIDKSKTETPFVYNELTFNINESRGKSTPLS